VSLPNIRDLGLDQIFEDQSGTPQESLPSFREVLTMIGTPEMPEDDSMLPYSYTRAYLGHVYPIYPVHARGFRTKVSPPITSYAPPRSTLAPISTQAHCNNLNTKECKFSVGNMPNCDAYLPFWA